MTTGPFTRLPRPPADANPEQWQKWYHRIYLILSGMPGIGWDIISKAGSKLTDIEERPHSDLQNIGQADDNSTDTSGGKHVTDAQLKVYGDHVRITDGNPHGTDHDMLDGLADDDHPQYLLLAGRSGQTITTPLILGSATNNTTIEADGTLLFNGSATVFDDITVDLSNVKAPALDPPTWTLYKSGELPAYSATASNVLYFRVQMPHRWKESSDIHFHLHAAYPNANSGDSRWTFTYAWANYGDAYPTATSVSQTFTAPAVADQHAIHAFTTLSGTGKTISSCIICSLTRVGGDAADTYGSVIYGVSADFHYEIDAAGSHSEYTK